MSEEGSGSEEKSKLGRKMNGLGRKENGLRRKRDEGEMD